MRTFLIFVLIIMVPIQGCKKNDPRGAQLDAETIQALKKVSQVRVFFGHQSVGADIVAGIKSLIAQGKEIELFVQDIEKGNIPNKPYFAHGRMGKNESPRSKCEAFEAVLQARLGKQVDIAFFKFCYLDVRHPDNEREILGFYQSTLDKMRLEYPRVKFIPVTVPLTTNENTWKYLAKKMLRREAERENNIKRNRYNDLLRDAYRGEAIFDLAALESTRPDGSREKFNYDGKIYYSLVPEYSSDGSHLNEYGSQRIAKGLILLLARVVSEMEK